MINETKELHCFAKRAKTKDFFIDTRPPHRCAVRLFFFTKSKKQTNTHTDTHTRTRKLYYFVTAFSWNPEVPCANKHFKLLKLIKKSKLTKISKIFGKQNVFMIVWHGVIKIQIQ